MEQKEISMKDMPKLLNKAYKNKSSDEYKCKGDIKKSPNYDMIDETLNKFIPAIKGYPSNQLNILQNTFKELKKPIWGKMTSEYMAKPDETNIAYAGMFVVCYRFMLGEIMSAYASSEATENGFVYDAGKIEEKSRYAINFLRRFSANPDGCVKNVIADIKHEMHKKSEEKIQQEAATVSAVGGAIEGVASLAEATFGAIGKVFKSALSLNPISFFSALFSRAYDKKVEKFKKFDDLYHATVEAYNEYRRIPQSKRKARIEHRYIKMMEKYNIKRENLRKQIEHYDRRAHEGDMYDDDEVEDVKETTKTKESTKHADKNNKNDESKTPQAASTVNTSDNKDDEDKKPASDDFDF